MNRWYARLLLTAVLLLGLPYPSPAPLIYVPGEGWRYEPYGSDGKWMMPRAKDQLEVAQTAFDKRDFKLAIKAAQRTVKMWPLSDYAPEAQYLLAESYEELGKDEKAFREYQIAIEKYPKVKNHQEIIQRQYDIANKFLAGKWFWKWGFIPLGSSMDKTVVMYEKIIKNGPYSEVAPQAQISIGTARDKQKEYAAAVKAYERAADRYNDQKDIASEALYKAAMAYYKQAKRAEYDQNAASQAIATFNDFITLYPDDPKIKGAAQLAEGLKTEQARGCFQIAKFYDKRKRYQGAMIYYNEAQAKDPNSSFAIIAKSRIEEIKRIMQAKGLNKPAVVSPPEASITNQPAPPKP